MKKITIYLILSMVLSIMVVATSLKECQRTMTTKEIPCIQLTSYLPINPCSNYNVTILDQNNISIANITFLQSLSSCYFTFTFSEPNIYYWNSSLESGVITVEAENNMIAIVLVFILLIGYFSILGAVNSSPGMKFLTYSLAIIELILLVAVIYISEGLGDYLVLLRINFYSILIIGFGLGMMTFFIKSAEVVSDTEILPMGDDTKWGNRKW